MPRTPPSEACDASIAGQAATLVANIEAARRQYSVDDWYAESLALFIQAVLQGGFVLAKARQDAKVAADCLNHLRRYLEFLFRPTRATEDR
jgi:TetR/AcrR family transcriptional regulator, transcriptional repressor for nem operon